MRHLIILLTLLASLCLAGVGWSEPGQWSDDNVWVELSTGVLPAAQYTFDPPEAYDAYELQTATLQIILTAAPIEFTAEETTTTVLMTLPMPTGGFDTFRIAQSPILSGEAAADLPDFSSYKGQSQSQPLTSCRFSLSDLGFHALVSSPDGNYEISTNQPDDPDNYICFWIADQVGSTSSPCGTTETSSSPLGTLPIGSRLREHTLAISFTYQYVDGMIDADYSAKLKRAEDIASRWINEGINIATRRDLARTFRVVEWLADPNDDFPENPSNNLALLALNDSFVRSLRPTLQCDLGHLIYENDYSTLGGVSRPGVCTGLKYYGASSHRIGVFDQHWQVMLHEMGHQLGADHTYNSIEGACTDEQRVADCAYEPGSGTTLLSYGDKECGTPTQWMRDGYFHVRSVAQIEGFVPCNENIGSINGIPSVNAGVDFAIPKNTAFRLSATGTDPDGDPLLYCWEQMDLGNTNYQANLLTGVLFRSGRLQTVGVREIPNPEWIPYGSEMLPTEDRQIHFNCTVRDGKGGVATDGVTITVSGEPLRVTYPNGGEEVPCGPWTVEWTGGGVASTVNISLTFDGESFTRLATATPNDGQEDVIFPCSPTSGAVLRVEAANGAFFDDSDDEWTLRSPVTIFVPSEEQTIEAALIPTKAGDTVAITVPGQYNSGPLEIPDGVTLMGTVDGVILAASSASYVVTFPDSCDKHTTLEHITVNAGTAGAILLRGNGTIRDCTIDGGPVGIDGQALVAASIIGCTLAGQTADGIRLVTASNSPDRVVVQNNVLTGGSSATGIRVAQAVSGSDLGPDISRNTLDGWNVGIDVTAATQPVVSYIRFNLIVGCSGYGVNCNSNSWAEITDNCAWQNGVNYACGVSYTNRTWNPLLCNTIEHGISPYALRVDSPISEENYEDGQIGARGVECACGVIERSSTLRSSETAVVLNDVTIPASRSLTVNGGATLLFDELDEGGGGADVTRNELIVTGTLDIGDPGGELVTLMSASETPAPGDWAGITVNPGGHLYVDWADIRHATIGVRNSGANPVLDIISLTDTRVREFQTAAVYVVPTSQTADGNASLGVDGCQIEMGNAPCGIYVADQSGYRAYSTYIGHTTITGSSAGMYGIYLAMRGPWPWDADVDSVSVSGLTTGTGVYVARYSPQLSGLIVSGCKWGAQLLGSGTPVLAPDQYLEMGSSFANCTTGLYVSADSVEVDSVSVNGCTIGMSTTGSSTGTYKDVDIAGGAIGLDARSTGRHTFREGSVTGFSQYGVKTVGVSGLDLGILASPGGNNIYSSVPGVLKYVSVKYPIDGLDIMAQENFWGEYPAPSGKFSLGVIYTPELQGLSLLRRPVRVGVMAPGPMLAANPNPFIGSVTVEFEVPADASGLELSIYDVRGRLVRSWRDEGATPGRYKQMWDGLDSRGTPVPVGLYFLQYRSGSTQRTTKVVRMVR